MAKNEQYNPSLTMPIIDMIVAVIIIVVSGYVWFHGPGVENLRNAHRQYEEARKKNQEDLQQAMAALEEARKELEETKREREMLKQDLEVLAKRYDEEIQRIRGARRLSEQYTDEVLDLGNSIQRAKDERRALNGEVYETTQQIAQVQAEIDALEQEARERNEEIARIEQWIAEAKAYLEENPPSRFPEKSSFASALDIGSDPGGAVVLSLAREITEVGKLNVGVKGGVGVGEEHSSLKEGLLFATLPIIHRKTSLAFEGGVSHLQVPGERKSQLSPFAGASFRFAPFGKERVFLTAGPRYSHEDVGLRVGVAFGGR